MIDFDFYELIFMLIKFIYSLNLLISFFEIGIEIIFLYIG